MQSLSLRIKQKSQQIRSTRDKTLKRQYSLELGELQHQLTLLLKQTPDHSTPLVCSALPFDEWKSLTTIGDRVKVLDNESHPNLGKIQKRYTLYYQPV